MAKDTITELAKRLEPLLLKSVQGVVNNVLGVFNADNLTPVGWSVIIPAATGIAGYIEIPFDVELSEVSLVGDVSGDCVVDIWMDTYANFPPTDADSITSSTPPTLDGAQTYQDSTLSGWTTTLPAGSWLAFNVDSFATVAQVTLAIKGERTA